MKRYFLIAASAFLSMGLYAQQLKVWINGRPDYLKDIQMIDSITFDTDHHPGDDKPEMKPGVYVIGPATAVESLEAKNLQAGMMSAGINEWDNEVREGMYEKYIVLEAGKEFGIAIADDKGLTFYGADLKASKLTSDYQELDGWKGAIRQDAKMQLDKTGFYHIILDLNADGKLDGTGGAQIVVAPVEWGIAGSMNSWGYLAADAQPNVKAGQTELTWTWTNVAMKKGTEFKFKHSGVWKIMLDDAGLVGANANLGVGMIPNGANIVVEEGGLYSVVLNYKMAKGEIAASYSFRKEKTSDIDYSDAVLCVVGDAVAEQTGAEADAAGDAGGWGWGNRFSMGKPAKSGNVYTWTATLNLLAAGGCKVRSYNTTDELYVEAGMEGGSANITVPADGVYTVTFTFDAVNGIKTVTVKEEGDGFTEVIARYNDTIVMKTLMPGYTHYSVEIDNNVNGIVAQDTVFVGCIGETTLHITANQTRKKDVKLTVVPRLPEEYMFTMPNLDWTRNRAALIKELGEPDNRIGLGTDSCYVYYSKDAAETFIYYYFNGETFDNLNEILVNISETDKEHGEMLKLFIAERYPYYGWDDMGGTTVWVYRNAANSEDADTQVLYYVKNGWNASFKPYSYSK